jgi:hypothetical protein
MNEVKGKDVIFCQVLQATWQNAAGKLMHMVTGRIGADLLTWEAPPYCHTAQRR